MFDISWKEVATMLAAGWVAGLSWFVRRLTTDVDSKVGKDDYRAELKEARESRTALHAKVDAMNTRLSRIEGRLR